MFSSTDFWLVLAADCWLCHWAKPLRKKIELGTLELIDMLYLCCCCGWRWSCLCVWIPYKAECLLWDTSHHQYFSLQTRQKETDRLSLATCKTVHARQSANRYIYIWKQIEGCRIFASLLTTNHLVPSIHRLYSLQWSPKDLVTCNLFDMCSASFAICCCSDNPPESQHLRDWTRSPFIQPNAERSAVWGFQYHRVRRPVLFLPIFICRLQVVVI